jgi:hypothetical protein
MIIKPSQDNLDLLHQLNFRNWSRLTDLRCLIIEAALDDQTEEALTLHLREVGLSTAVMLVFGPGGKSPKAGGTIPGPTKPSKPICCCQPNKKTVLAYEKRKKRFLAQVAEAAHDSDVMFVIEGRAHYRRRNAQEEAETHESGAERSGAMSLVEAQSCGDSPFFRSDHVI